MDKPTLRVLHGVPTAPVRLDSGLAPDDPGRFASHQAGPPHRLIRPGRAARRLYQAIVSVLETAGTGRPRRPLPPVVAAEDRASM